MTGPRQLLVAAAVACIGSLLLVSCGGGTGGDDGEALISITLRLPDSSPEETARFSDRILQAIERDRAGSVTAVKQGEKLFELTIRIEELSDINRIKKAIIGIEPAAEYRIEHR